MELKILVDNELERLSGKLSRKTYEKFPVDKRPILISNNYFYLNNLVNDIVIIEIDESIVNDDTFLYLHTSAKELYYTNIDLIKI